MAQQVMVHPAEIPEAKMMGCDLVNEGILPMNLIEFTITPPKFNIAPKKLWLEDYFPIGKVTFQGRTVKLWGGTSAESKHQTKGVVRKKSTQRLYSSNMQTVYYIH